MDWSSLAQTVTGLGAPVLGSVLGGLVGGPAGAALGSQAGKMLANALGCAPTPEAVSKTISDNPEVAVEKIKQLEQENANELQEVIAHLEDVQDARKMQEAALSANSRTQWVAPILTGMIILLFAAMIFALFFVPRDIPPNVLQLLNISFGTVSAAFVLVLNFWFGTSRSSERNGDAVRAIAATNSSSTHGLLASVLRR